MRTFSWPGGLPSHLSPLHPGVIHEGGELGYALAKSFGAAFDNPDLIVACIVGDGEFETGPTATAWHSTKFLDPAHDGAVLPLLHRNGYKIANPTVPGTMDDDELRHAVRGLRLAARGSSRATTSTRRSPPRSTESYADIRTIQADARAGRPPERPQWPVIVVTSPKGWTGIKELDGVPIEGTWRAHQVPAADCATNPEHLAAVEGWLRSYAVDELLEPDGAPVAEILSVCPRGVRRMGCNPHALGGSVRVPLAAAAARGRRGRGTGSRHAGRQRARRHGRVPRRVVSANAAQRNFRIVCPDELDSNKLGAVLDVTTRAYEWPLRPVDIGHGRDGRVLEMLSEHNCQGWLEGYILTGRHGLFPSYEAFVEIVTGMANQLAKFLKVAARARRGARRSRRSTTC